MITTNSKHPALALKDEYPNLHLLFYKEPIDFLAVFSRFKTEFGIEHLTIQTGGTLNALFLRLGLIDRVSIVIAPCLIGGKDTQSLIGGQSLHTQAELQKLGH